MEKVIHHFCHEHPLFLTKQHDEETLNCYVCGNVVTNCELEYTCKEPHYNSNSRIIIHKMCGELPRRIHSHPSHPDHPLYLCDYRLMPKGYFCNPCRYIIGSKLGYRCPICEFDTRVECIKLGLLEERKELQHLSHIHPLTLMRKHTFPFSCDGCGTEDVDMAYICIMCEYWVHASCASLPILLPQDRHQHKHQLSLAFCFPMEHRRYIYNCDVCDKEFDMACWLYFCGDCRYFAHLKCVGSVTDSDQTRHFKMTRAKH
ncbi:uncharacterized protein LOC121755251 [Salvia splendens]|uniref:uncharacterized protein LOC121755251 n=1 Tax=Salvia splendens TaxID=180675 RepID=UPI001C251DD8|nr:uncharacterized protein LOC121755251 [Salvia splendens]